MTALAANAVKKCAGKFRGQLLLYEATPAVNVSGATKVNWALSTQRVNVSLTEPIRDTIKRFARATDLHLGSIGFTDSTVNADINVQSPLQLSGLVRVRLPACGGCRLSDGVSGIAQVDLSPDRTAPHRAASLQKLVALGLRMTAGPFLLGMMDLIDFDA